MPRLAKTTTKPAALKDIEAGLRQLTIGLRGLAREISSGKANGTGVRRRKVTRALRLQGRYMGLIRTLPKRKKAKVMAIRASKGVDQAIRAARLFRA